MLDTIIRGGTIVDGTGKVSYSGDVGIKDGAIIELGKVESVGRHVIDAEGAMVTPGFIDVHTHYDGQLIWDSRMDPSFSNGVTTVVAKLLLSVHPDIAFFGEKDFQQLAVIRRMATDLNLGVEIAGVSTVRDPDGLALSSRNALLSPSDREKAGGLLSTLADLGGAITRGATVGPAIERAIENLIRNGFEPVDYVAYVDGGTLEPLDEYREGGRLIAAAFLGGVRLIDNISV